MTDNLVAAMKPEIRLKCRNIKKEDIKIIFFFSKVWWQYATLFEIYYFFNIHSYNTITLRSSFTIRRGPSSSYTVDHGIRI
jgi:hypothetical protein